MEKQDLKTIKIVDSREPASIRTSLIERGWNQSQLKSGDFFFYTCKYHKVGITRKTTEDCLSSIEKVFGKQLEEMLDFYNICIILIENPWRWTPAGQIITNRGLERHIKKEILNYLHRWQAKGFILERTANTEDTINRLNELYALYQKPYSLSAKSKGYSDERVLALPSGVRGKSGEELLKGHSLRDIANMDADDILELGINNIGKKRANLIEEHFTRNGNADSKSDEEPSKQSTLL